MNNLSRLLVNKLVTQTKLLNKIYNKKKPSLMDYHSHLTIRLGFEFPINFKGTFVSVKGKEACSHYLGYSTKELEELWSFGEEFGLKNHPIYSIMTEDSKKKCFGIGMKFPTFFKASGSGDTDLGVSMNFPVDYIHKDGHLVPSFYMIKLSPFNMTLKVKTIFNYTENKYGAN